MGVVAVLPVPSDVSQVLSLLFPILVIPVVSHVCHHKVHQTACDVDGGADGGG